MRTRARFCADRVRPANRPARTRQSDPTDRFLTPLRILLRIRPARMPLLGWVVALGCFLSGALWLVADDMTSESDEITPPDNAAEASVDPQEQTLPVRARINLWQELGVIDPFIYGLSISRSDGGLHSALRAEMLDDRKFFRPPTSSGSPWHRLGGETGWSLTYDVERPYAGQGSVKITVTHRAEDEAHGIQQLGLALVDGQLYVGHVTVAGYGSIKAILQWGDRAGDRDPVTIRIGQEGYGRYPIRFRAGRSTDDGVLSIGLETTGSVWIGAVSLMPADHIDGLRADTVALLKELNAPVYRWPGGLSVTGYDWRDGIGPRDRRPPRQYLDQPGLDSNDFGIDEFLHFCRIVGAEPVVVLDTGLGSPELAAALAQYCNGSVRTVYGRRRALHGHAEPHDVKWWGVGGGMPGDGQSKPLSPADQLLRHQEFVHTMRATNDRIKLIAAGGSESWSEQILAQSGDTMDLLNEPVSHRLPTNASAGSDITEIIANTIRSIATTHQARLGDISISPDHLVPIALDAWNHWPMAVTNDQPGSDPALLHALAIARGLHEMTRHPTLFRMAHQASAATSHPILRISGATATFTVTGLPLLLYRQQFGVHVLHLDGQTDPLDVAVALTSDRLHATIGIVNPTAQSAELHLDVRGGRLASEATLHRIANPDPHAAGQPGQEPDFAIEETTIADFNPQQIHAPPQSISLYVVPVDR